jgi:dCTP deaminase
VDEDRTNNNPWNLVRMNAAEHIRYHNRQTFGAEFDAAEHSASIRAAYERLRQDDDWYRAFTQSQKRKAVRFWHDEAYAEARRQLIAKYHARWTPAARLEQQEKQERFWESHPEQREEVSLRSRAYWASVSDQRRERQREIARRLNTRSEISEAAVREALDQAGSIRGAARLLNCDRTVFRRFPHVIQAFRGIPPANHKVVAVQELKGDHDVYCLTVPEAENFALAAGAFVRNCGIIVNATPLEPGWRGRLVLEFSNSADLPVRIYANEGVAQVTFFESDEECEISYADRQGKYQDQTGLVTPRL